MKNKNIMIVIGVVICIILNNISRFIDIPNTIYIPITILGITLIFNTIYMPMVILGVALIFVGAFTEKKK